MSMVLPDTIKGRLVKLATRLLDQEAARVLIEPQQDASGFWFGGGDIIRDGDSFVIAGRYRNVGDSRTGLTAGERGLECALFRGANFGGPYDKIKSFSKADLAVDGKEVTSIEGTALRYGPEGVELFISSEKDVAYPDEVREFQKPGTGVWTIDVVSADSVDALSSEGIRQALSSTTPASLHVKDPVIADEREGDTELIFCAHPFSWTCSYTGRATRKAGEADFHIVSDCILPRGHVWDVAATRVTDRLRVPRMGALADWPALSLYFYDGAECVRQHDEDPKSVKRPRGWSCEEIGGLAWGWDDAFPRMERLSVNFPLFVSPKGTGCSRYTSTLVTGDAVYAAWQQSRDDLSQPLVGHALAMEEVTGILA